MSNSCDSCGFRTSEVKGGGPISDRGTNWTAQIQEPEDLQRDVIKAETASISIPELDFEVTSGSFHEFSANVHSLMQHHLLLCP